jgi:hypothetical protein
LALHLRELKAGSLKFLIFVGDAPSHETKAGRRFPLRPRCRLITKVALHERPQLFVVHQDHIFAHTSEPPLEHNFNQPVVFFVGRSGRLGEWESGDDRLRVVVREGVIELLKLHI